MSIKLFRRRFGVSVHRDMLMCSIVLKMSAYTRTHTRAEKRAHMRNIRGEVPFLGENFKREVLRYGGVFDI